MKYQYFLTKPQRSFLHSRKFKILPSSTVIKITLLSCAQWVGQMCSSWRLYRWQHLSVWCLLGRRHLWTDRWKFKHYTPNTYGPEYEKIRISTSGHDLAILAKILSYFSFYEFTEYLHTQSNIGCPKLLISISWFNIISFRCYIHR